MLNKNNIFTCFMIIAFKTGIEMVLAFHLVRDVFCFVLIVFSVSETTVDDSI